MFFDLNDGDFVIPISDKAGIDPEGNIMIRVSNNVALEVNSGEIHAVSGLNDFDDPINNDVLNDNDDDANF